MMNDAAIGAVVLVGDHNWRKGPRLKALAAFCFGRRQRFTHLGKACVVVWFKDEPFLTSFKEVSNGG